jgi:aspartate/methionine/tyrosine aminotransferase
MTGLRIGYVIAPKKYMYPLQKLAQNFFVVANNMNQRAWISALKLVPMFSVLLAFLIRDAN